MTPAVTRLLYFMSRTDHPLSASLHDELAGWLLPSADTSAESARGGGGGGGDGSGGGGGGGGAAALPAKHAKPLLRAWVGLAVPPGSPGRATLPALVQALDPKLGAVDVVQRALNIRLDVAGTAEDIHSMFDAAGGFFGRPNTIHALRKLAALCAPSSGARMHACSRSRTAHCARGARGRARARPRAMPAGACARRPRADASLVGPGRARARAPGRRARASAPWCPRSRARCAATCRS